VVVKGGTYAKELRGAVLCEEVDIVPVQLVGEKISDFDCDSDSEHESYHRNCYPSSESERGLKAGDSYQHVGGRRR